MLSKSDPIKQIKKEQTESCQGRTTELFFLAPNMRHLDTCCRGRWSPAMMPMCCMGHCILCFQGFISSTHSAQVICIGAMPQGSLGQVLESCSSSHMAEGDHVQLPSHRSPQDNVTPAASLNLTMGKTEPCHGDLTAPAHLPMCNSPE